MKLIMIFNTITNTIIIGIFITWLLKKYFHISVARHIFTDKIESISLMYNTGWFKDGKWCSAISIFTIPLAKTTE